MSEPLTVEAMVRFWRKLSDAAQHAPQPIKWVMYMRPEVYSRLLPRSRQKLQPYVRKAWRSRQ